MNTEVQLCRLLLRHRVRKSLLYSGERNFVWISNSEVIWVNKTHFGNSSCVFYKATKRGWRVRQAFRFRSARHCRFLRYYASRRWNQNTSLMNFLRMKKTQGSLLGICSFLRTLDRSVFWTKSDHLKQNCPDKIKSVQKSYYFFPLSRPNSEMIK